MDSKKKISVANEERENETLLLRTDQIWGSLIKKLVKDKMTSDAYIQDCKAEGLRREAKKNIFKEAVKGKRSERGDRLRQTE